MRTIFIVLSSAFVLASAATTKGGCFSLQSGTLVCPPIKGTVGSGCVELNSGSVVC